MSTAAKTGTDPRTIGLELIFRHGLEARHIAVDTLQRGQRRSSKEKQRWAAILAAIDELLRPEAPAPPHG
jgi:hypothetical protein